MKLCKFNFREDRVMAIMFSRCHLNEIVTTPDILFIILKTIFELILEEFYFDFESKIVLKDTIVFFMLSTRPNTLL